MGPRRTPFTALAGATALLLACLAAAPLRAADPDFPNLSGRVVDQADLLSDAEEAALSDRLAALEKETTDQLVVVTLKSLQGYPIEEFGYRLGRHWGIGRADRDNGVLLIVAPNERRVRIEVGRGLEPQLTDAISRIIIENAILPRFRQDDFLGGIKAGVGNIAAVLTGDAEAVTQRAAGGQDERGELVTLLIIAFWLIIFGVVVWSIIQGAGGGKGNGWAAVPGGGARRSSGGWSSGGGFSGGGGGFGGGGASGSW